MWLCRTGRKNEYYKMMIDSCEMFLPWEGFNIDLSTLDSRADFRQLVKKEMNVDNKTSIANWSSQLYSFCNELSVGDLVLLPEIIGRYSLIRVTGAYEYHKNSKHTLHHSRSIILLKNEIPRDIFPQDIKYSLQAYRTLFQVKQEEEVLNFIQKWNKIR